jgi:hypothetical protein
MLVDVLRDPSRRRGGHHPELNLNRETMTKIRKILLALLLFGVTGTAIGAGTFASFTASTTNQSSTFATGTLVLTNKVGAGQVCSSDTVSVDDNDYAGCDVVFSGLTDLKPGSPAALADLTLAKGGSLAPTALKYAMSACDPDDSDSGSIHGNGDPCDAVKIYIQEYTGGFGGSVTDSCVFPVDTEDPCATDFSASTNALSDVPDTLTTIAGGLSASRYFRIGVRLLDDGDQNDLQGRKADFAFTWSVVQ